MMGFEYTGNLIVNLKEGLSAERQGVCKGWKIGEVNGEAMPSKPGSEAFIHENFGKIKNKDDPITIIFELPDGSKTTLHFESYVTRADLKEALSGSTLAAMLGAKMGKDEDLEKLFETLDADHDNAIERPEWLDFVTKRMQELADMYDKLHHTKMMGIEYTANTILGMHAGLSAEAQGVQKGWKIDLINGTQMPDKQGDESFIHDHIAKIKEKDVPITIKFKLPDGSDKELTFESYVTRSDLTGALASARHFSVFGVFDGAEEPFSPKTFADMKASAKKRGSILS